MSRLTESNKTASEAIIAALREKPLSNTELMHMFNLRQDQLRSIMRNLAFELPIYCDGDGDEKGKYKTKSQKWHILEV